MTSGQDEQGIADPPPARPGPCQTRRPARQTGRGADPTRHRCPGRDRSLRGVTRTIADRPPVPDPGLEMVLLVALIATNPWRMTRQTRWSRWASLALAVLVVTSNLATLGLLVVDLVSDQDTPGTQPAGRGPAGLGHERHRVRVDLLGTRPGRPRRPHPEAPRRTTARRSSGSPRTKPRTPSSKSPPGPARRRTGSPPSSTTSTCPPRTPVRSAQPTPCP